MKRSPLNAMSGKRRAKLAAAGVANPFSTLVNGGAVGRGSAPRLAAPAPKQRRTRDTGPTADVRALIAARCGGWCEWPACPRPYTDVHHRLNRKSGGRHGAAAVRINGAGWLLAACRPHHERVTNPVGDVRVEAERMGWILREHQDAEVTPVFTRHGWVLLGGDGGFEPYSLNHDTTPTEVPMTEINTTETTPCVRCTTTAAADGVCCSSHGKRLCHLCYRRTHFVEVCVAGCQQCAAEGLPVLLADLTVPAVTA
ncbi:hypothetical protein ACFYUR_12445 [Micromonospora haikouensis]|uniref:hypothetical protein n=1 Tax=Micromonospora haikouensis TaxID=686309 RepID=UPI00369989BC